MSSRRRPHPASSPIASPTAPSLPRATPIYLLAAWIGAASLLAELVWTRYLHLVFGVSAYAVATVLACFMLGLALGNAFIGRRLEKGASPDRTLLYLLTLLGLYTACFPFLYTFLPPLLNALTSSPAAPADSLQPLLLRGSLAFLILLLPTSCIGGTFPALVAWAAHSRGPNPVARIYGYNTLGGVAGTLLAGLFILQRAGMRGTLWIAAAMALLAAAFVFLHARKRKNSPLPPASPPSPASPPDNPSISPHLPYFALAIAGISGLTSLAYQVLWTRLLTLFFRDTVYDFTIVLAVFLAGIVLGSFACQFFLRSAQRAAHALGWTQLAIAAVVLLGLHFAYRLPFLLNDLQTNKSVLENYGDRFWIVAMSLRLGYAALALLPATCLLGAAFPLAARVWTSRPNASPASIGILTAINVAAAAAGALLGGFLLVPLLHIQGSFMFLATLNALAGISLLYLLWQKNRAFLAAGAVTTLLLLMAAAPAWDRLRMSTGFLDQDQPLHELLHLHYYREDATGLTSVVELLPYRQRYLVTNRLYAQNTSDLGGLQDHRRLGHIPMLLHPNPRSILAVGLGAGITLRGIVDLSPDSADVVELSRGVLEAADHFSAENARALEDPRVRIIVQDGRNYLTTLQRKQYDLILLDILHPMSSGSSSVFSREYYELCKQHLVPPNRANPHGGLVCQWLPVHQLSADSLRTIFRTFQSVFPHTTVWYGLLGDSTQVVGLFGTHQPLTIDATALAARYAHASEPLQRSLREVNLGNPHLLLSHFLMGESTAAAFSATGRIDTDDRPLIEFEAPRLATTAARQGKLNLLALAPHTDPVAPLLSSPSTLDLPTLDRYRAGKRTLIEALRFDLRNEPEARTTWLRTALQRDPANEDLLSLTPPGP